MHLEKLQAIVLSSTDYGDSDRIAALFTLEHGRLNGFARGARNSRKRFGPALETFARIDLQIAYKEGLSSLRQADVITVYPGIRADLGSIAHALYACELVECVTPEVQPLPRLYRLLVAYLDRLDSGHEGDLDRRHFEVNLLNILGYRPSLESCSRCGSIFSENGAIMLQGGELVCRFCSATGRHIAIKVLQGLLACLSTSRFGLVQFSDEDLLLAGALLDEAVEVHSCRKMKTLEFLRQTTG
ncbi:MAG: DNA repair protein RecO [Desulfuromonadaceae bacterium]|nr:DNA repair protein RecO [Desulfuromonadaceae bacterium]